MLQRLLATALGVALAVAAGVLAWFLHGQGLERAGAWAGIIGLLGIPLGLSGTYLAWPREQSHDRQCTSPSKNIQINSASSGGSVFGVQNGKQRVVFPGDEESDIERGKK
jgi:hypothetical protein